MRAKKAFRVIDADGHIAEPESLWEKYLQKKYRERRPRIIRDNWGKPRYLLEGRLHTTPPGRGMGNPDGWGIAAGSDTHKGSHDPAERLKDLDLEGIDIAVIFPTLMVTVAAGTLPTRDYGLDVALCHAYNNWLADFCRHEPRRLKPVAVLPLRVIDESVKELQRCVKELGAVAVDIPTYPCQKNPSDAYFFHLYEEAQELGIPVMLHASGGQQVPYAGWERFDNYVMGHAISHPFEQMIAVSAMICEGVLEKFSRLKFAFLESGIGWVPYWMERLDERFERRAKEIPLCRKPPSEYMKSEQCFFSCDPDEKLLKTAVEFLGQKRIIYASDYPHWDARYPDTVRLIRENPTLSDSAKAMILGGNAGRLFGLK